MCIRDSAHTHLMALRPLWALPPSISSSIRFYLLIQFTLSCVLCILPKTAQKSILLASYHLIWYPITVIFLSFTTQNIGGFLLKVMQIIFLNLIRYTEILLYWSNSGIYTLHGFPQFSNFCCCSYLPQINHIILYVLSPICSSLSIGLLLRSAVSFVPSTLMKLCN